MIDWHKTPKLKSNSNHPRNMFEINAPFMTNLRLLPSLSPIGNRSIGEEMFCNLSLL